MMGGFTSLVLGIFPLVMSPILILLQLLGVILPLSTPPLDML